NDLKPFEAMIVLVFLGFILRRPSLYDLLLTLTVLALSLQSVRHIALFVAAAIPILISSWSGIWQDVSKRRGWRLEPGSPRPLLGRGLPALGLGIDPGPGPRRLRGVQPGPGAARRAGHGARLGARLPGLLHGDLRQAVDLGVRRVVDELADDRRAGAHVRGPDHVIDVGAVGEPDVGLGAAEDVEGLPLLGEVVIGLAVLADISRVGGVGRNVEAEVPGGE